MKCRYCGQEVRVLANGLNSNYGQQCKTSLTGKHAALTDGVHCVYCGRETRIASSGLMTDYGPPNAEIRLQAVMLCSNLVGITVLQNAKLFTAADFISRCIHEK